MAAFYEMALNLKPIAATRTDSWVEFDLTSTKFALHAIPLQIAADIDISSPPRARENTPVKLTFEVEDMDSECQRLASLGAIVLSRPWGICNVLDPEGNVFEIHSSK
jgi:hypothetical protein